MLAAQLEARLRAIGTPERAIGEKAYLKSDLDFLGTSVWQIRAEVKAALADMATLDHDGLVALVEALWREPIFERRMAATVLLDARSGLLVVDDLALLEPATSSRRCWPRRRSARPASSTGGRRIRISGSAAPRSWHG